MNSSKEIDLVVLIAKGFAFLSDNLKLIAATFVLSVGTGCIFYFISPKTYESSMIIQSDILTESYAEQIANNLHKLIKERNDSTIAAKFGVTLTEASQLKKIEFESAFQNTGIIQEKDKIIFLVTIQLSNYSSLSKFQDGILKYLENNEYVKLRVSLKKEEFIHLIEKIDKEIKGLDSMKTQIGLRLKPSSNRTESPLFFLNGGDFYRQSIELYREKFKTETELGKVKSIQLIEPFSPLKKPVSPKLSVSIAAAVTLGMMILGAILGIKILKKTSDKLKSYTN
jgi:hypothetical protein